MTPDTPTPAGSKSIVLIVDDELGIRKMLEGFLLPDGYELATAADGPEALAKARTLAPDLILLDVMMPGMSGFDVCRQLRADPHLAQVPIILVTVLDDRASRLEGLEAGADDFISKPLDRAELRARVRTITRLNRYRRLLAERAKFEWVIEQANDGYLVLNDQEQVTYANPRARLYLELGPDEFLSRTFLELARARYHCEPGEAWAAWPDMSAPLYLVRPETPTASAFWLQVSALAVPVGAGEGADRVIRLHDVTERRALHESLSRFHSVISHKLRTPLTGLVGSLELMARFGEGMSKDELGQFIQVALNGSQRLRGEVEDILSYTTTPRLAKPGAEFELAQLPALVAEIGATLGLESLTISGCERLDSAVKLPCSREGIELIFWEILENAQKFHPRHCPTVEISVSCPDAGFICLQIKDDGQTLSPEQLARAWTPYYQGEKSFTGEVAGMGLGLSMVATITWGVGGACHIYNRDDGPGVVVELTFPSIFSPPPNP